MIHKGEVAPPQSTQLSPAAAGVDRQNVESVVEDMFLRQSVEEVLCLLVRGDELLPVLRVRQVDHPGGVLRNDLVALGIAEDGGHYGQVLLHGGLLDGPALVGSLSQLYKQIFQRHRPQLPQLDGANVGVDPLQHSPVTGESAGSVRWRLLSGPGSFLFFLPNLPLWGPNRPLTGLGRVVPPPGVELGHTGPPGAKLGTWVVLWDGWLWEPVPEGTQGTQNSARGGLDRAFPRVQGGNAHQCTLQFTHNM